MHYLQKLCHVSALLSSFILVVILHFVFIDVTDRRGDGGGGGG
jgi:hypothetical protein